MFKLFHDALSLKERGLFLIVWLNASNISLISGEEGALQERERVTEGRENGGSLDGGALGTARAR